MACELHIVALDIDSAPHDQEITFDEVAFNPKACIVISAGGTSANTVEDSSHWGRGFWAEGNQQHTYGAQKSDGTNGQAYRLNQGGSVHKHCDTGSGAVLSEFNIKSVVAGTCTIEITTQNGDGTLFLFLFIDAEEACVGTDITPTSTGNDTITHANLDFTPNCIFFSGDQNDLLNEVELEPTQGWFGFSVGSGSSDELSISWMGKDGASGVDSQLNQSYAMFMRDLTTTRTAATNVSMGDSQFIMDFDASPTAAPKYFMFLALKLDDVFVENNEAMSTSTTTDQEITGVGFQPQGVMFLSGNHTAFDADKGHVGVVNGFATEASGNNACCTLAGKTSSPQNMERRTDNDDCIVTLATEGQAIENEGRVSAWDSDGFDIDWSTASTKKFGFIALSHALAGAGITAPVLGRARFQPTLTRDVQRLRGFRNT